MLPDGYVVHNISERLRIKIESRKRDLTFFKKLAHEIENQYPELAVQTNPMTGSILILGEVDDFDALTKFFKDEKLLLLTVSLPQPKPLAQHLAKPIGEINKAAGKYTGGMLDISSAVFVGLLTFGIIELARGNLRMPPWYTAFWYAFGVFSKSIADKTLITDSNDIFLDDE